MENFLQPTPWDKRNFHVDTYEVTSLTEEALKQTNEIEGHFTLKTEPLASKESLRKYGFYYVDTLIEPVCEKDNLQVIGKEGIELSREFPAEEILAISGEAFAGGRFHRDPEIPNFMADNRYRNWVKDLIEEDKILAFYYQGELAGFYAYQDDKVLLLGIHQDFRGKGLTKACTSLAVQEHFRFSELDSIRTSISPSNLASLNLFLSLGFKMKSSVDIYHKLNGSLPVGV
ncbi:GNAT family N-acetyltransferase [Oceanobacillus manasiensis]|uniref:GNAT family N-acetyltransferase n=1 Tax=Oceanobacillus manasiensis TaxID=586413 RepID=UPI0009FF32C4|nr:GNAT family N-acetyltransferase [Oceanobacillus manasiensis]